MGVESADTIQELNQNWPLGTDPKSEGDDHLRLIKRVLRKVIKDGDGVFGVTGDVRLLDTDGDILSRWHHDGTKVILDARDPTGAVQNAFNLDQFYGYLNAGKYFQGIQTDGTQRYRLYYNSNTAGQAAARVQIEAYDSLGVKGQHLNLDGNGASIMGGNYRVTQGDSSTVRFQLSGNNVAGQAAKAYLQALNDAGASVGAVGYEDTVGGYTAGPNGFAFRQGLATTPRGRIAFRTGAGVTGTLFTAAQLDDAGAEAVKLEYTTNVMSFQPVAASAAVYFTLRDGAGVVRTHLFSSISALQTDLINYAGDGSTVTSRLRLGATNGLEVVSPAPGGQAGIVTTEGNLGAQLAAGIGAGVGGYVMARNDGTASVVGANTIVAGSTLVYSNASGSSASGALSGSYKCCGRATASSDATAANRVTNWQKVA